MPKKRTTWKRKRGRPALKRQVPGSLYRFNQGRMGYGTPYYINREVPVYVPYRDPLKDITTKGKGITAAMEAWGKPVKYVWQAGVGLVALVAPYQIAKWNAEQEAAKQQAYYETQAQTAKKKKQAEHKARGEEFAENLKSTKKLAKGLFGGVWTTQQDIPPNQCSAHFLDAPYSAEDVSRAVSFASDTVVPTVGLATTTLVGAALAYKKIKRGFA